ncbi:MAG: hypothetical protein JNJ71_06205 [Rubrivivax sp.]|nr:hypothetical protein [Rubrivivax sp.]
MALPSSLPGEPELSAMEQALRDFAQALGQSDPATLERCSQALRASLLKLGQRARNAGQRQPPPGDAPQRLRQAQATAHALRAAVARSGTSVGRALEVLSPSAPGAYGPRGSERRAGSSGALLA